MAEDEPEGAEEPAGDGQAESAGSPGAESEPGDGAVESDPETAEEAPESEATGTESDPDGVDEEPESTEETEPETAGEESGVGAPDGDVTEREPSDETNAASADPGRAAEQDPSDDGTAEAGAPTVTSSGRTTLASPKASSPVDVLPPERRVTAPIGAVRALQKASEAAEDDGIPADVKKYQRFKKVDGAQYERVNEFLRERTYVTAREWAIARLCSDFRTETGIEMTKIGENLPHLVPFMTDTYTPQAVNQARSSFETKVRKSGATFLYGAMSDFFTADELDDIMYEVTEVAKFLLEVEGVDLSVDEELEGEERISSVMREVRAASDELRHEGTTCPNCGHEIGGGEHEH